MVRSWYIETNHQRNRLTEEEAFHNPLFYTHVKAKMELSHGKDSRREREREI